MAAVPSGDREGSYEQAVGLRRAHASLLPASGAWREGDPVGDRQLLSLGDRAFALEGGGVLRDVTIAYETWGTLAERCVERRARVPRPHRRQPRRRTAWAPGTRPPGWWDGLDRAGPRPSTPTGGSSCAPTSSAAARARTGPASPHPDDGEPWGSRFPVVSVRDWVRSQAALADHLGIRRWHSVVGGSMGGMQVLEWAVMYPDRVASIVPIATALAASAQQIAWWSTGRRVIRMDPRWRGGDYYDAAPGDGPHESLSVARMVSQITFRSDDVFTRKFGREVVEPLDGFSLWQRFEVERYLEYQGDKLVRRFDANSYLLLTKAMDLHDVGRGRGGTDAAMARVRAPVLAIGVESDILYPLYQSQEIVTAARAGGLPARSVELDSPHGHDAFLIEHDQVGIPLSAFLDDVETQ